MGLCPNIPLKYAGIRIEPPMSDPGINYENFRGFQIEIVLGSRWYIMYNISTNEDLAKKYDSSPSTYSSLALAT